MAKFLKKQKGHFIFLKDTYLALPSLNTFTLKQVMKILGKQNDPEYQEMSLKRLIIFSLYAISKHFVKAGEVLVDDDRLFYVFPSRTPLFSFITYSP